MNTKFRQQLIKQQLFTADVDIKSWLKALRQNRQKCFFYKLQYDNLFCQMLRFESDPI